MRNLKGQFTKGYKQIVSEETKRKLSLANKGKKHSEETKRKISLAGLGRKRSKESIEKTASKLRGKKRKPFSEEWKSNISKGNLGKKLSFRQKEIALQNIRQYNFKLGKDHPNWKGGITQLRNKHSLTDIRYKNWRKAVFERDDYICQQCKARNGNGKEIYLEAHHIKEWVDYPELRFELSNGLTLCNFCHNKTKNPSKWVERKRNADKGKSICETM